MDINFNCPHCGKSLNTTDDRAGAQAKCPNCSEMVTVPSVAGAKPDVKFDEGSGENLFAPLPSLPKSASSSGTGTKTCPMCGEESPQSAKACQACGEFFEDNRRGNGFLEVGDVISASWTIYMKKMGIVIGSVIVVGLVSSAASLPTQICNIINNVREQQGQNPEPILEIVGVLFLIPSYLVGYFLQLGLTRVLFKVARGKEANLGDVFSGGRYFWRMLGSTVLFGLMILAGMIACIIPGILVGLMFWPYVFVLIDEDSSGVNCLWRSKEITKGTWGSAFVLFLAIFGINVLGFLACCVGIIFTAPLSQLMLAVAYCRMTAQRTAE